MTLSRRLTATWTLLCALGCGEPGSHDDPALPVAVRINEVVSDNEGVWVDELGQTDDYVELYNASDDAIDLGELRLRDTSGLFPLPPGELEPGEVRLFWADGEPEQGELHLPFRVDKEGEHLALERADGTVWDDVEVPALGEHHAWSRFPDGIGEFEDCGWASPERQNGSDCEPGTTSELPEEIEFESVEWPSPWPPTPTPLALTELALRPAAFVEVVNTSDDEVDLEPFELRVAPSDAGVAWPAVDVGAELAWPVATLGPGERLVVPVSSTDVEELAADPRFEGVVTLWDTASGEAIDRVDFDDWPDGGVFARDGTPAAAWRFCEDATPGADSDDCEAVTSRPLSDHVRSLATPGDFTALAAARARTGIAGVEFIVDMDAGDRVTLLNSADWDLHYLFISERIDGEPHVDRCTPEGYTQFHQGWYYFSVEQYFQAEGRRYLLGNLVHHAGPDLHTVEFAVGDVITAELMERAFYAVLRAVPDPTQWAIRPQDATQVARARELEGRVPLVDPNAPYRDVDLQPLSPGIAYGTLRFVPAAELDGAVLGPHDILITDQVPNDLPYVAGLVTEAIQTPLSHVNVLSRARGTPNLFLRDARDDPTVDALLDELVRLEVRSADFTLEPATAAEAIRFWDEREASVEPAIPRLDVSVRGPQPLEDHDLASLPALGGKSAQLAELLRVLVCPATSLPEHPFALPVSHSLDHFATSGAESLLASLREDDEFITDPTRRAAGLAEVRQAILDAPLDPELLDSVMAAIDERLPDTRLRFRSSSNTEDLASFSGAGLYTSVGWEPSEGRDGVADAIRTVWASLWNARAYDEREAAHVDQASVGMGVLIHPAYHHETANGVIVSRDIVDPMRGDRHYVNAQIGEALVTNPAPGVQSDQFAVTAGDPSRQIWRSVSGLPGEHPVLRPAEIEELVCSMLAVHEHFARRLDPEGTNGWFAMDVEFKLVGPDRQVALKQARPYSFGVAAPTGWCDL